MVAEEQARRGLGSGCGKRKEMGIFGWLLNFGVRRVLGETKIFYGILQLVIWTKILTFPSPTVFDYEDQVRYSRKYNKRYVLAYVYICT